MKRGLKKQYTPDRLERLARTLEQSAAKIARHAESMRQDHVVHVLVGDAMLRRSYDQISKFAVAIERELQKSRARGADAPWDDPASE